MDKIAAVVIVDDEVNVLASMNRTKAGVLDEAGALPMAPLTKAFVVTTVNKKR